MNLQEETEFPSPFPDTASSETTDPKTQERKFPFGDDDVTGIVIAVAIGVGIGVVVGFSLLGLVVAGRKCARMSKKKKKKPNPRDLSQIEIPSHGKLPDLPAKEGKYSRTPSCVSSEEGIYQVPMTPPQQIYDSRVSPYPAYQTAMQTQPVAGSSSYDDGHQAAASDGGTDTVASGASGSQARGDDSFRGRPDARHVYETTTNFNRSTGKESYRKSIDTDPYDTSAALRRAGQKIYDGVENLRY
ncbi:hypothetical protein CAPTEDRAFT_201166 [Capitella teleta]|uniref:Uncharacterized protein n=1 Tax=Capitella teleta TaxID=283909 RepID=R7VHI5_CAPTE|nr:hypothetical protein CAPTEDRAFT_201166 [Capitella teleta]|eukprot:ELU15746.1 hypothetical protein CAPTEDRAFT_201166 [Capitella teleta]